MGDRRKIASAPSSIFSPQFSLFVFASAFCLGMVGPTLYFITRWSPQVYPACVGMLFAANALGRMLPRSILPPLFCQKRLAIWLLIAALGYGILAVSGGMHFQPMVTDDLIYLAVFLIGPAMAEVPFVRSFTQRLNRRSSDLRSWAFIGFVLGGLAIALFGCRDHPTYVPATKDLVLGGSVAAIISLISGCAVLLHSGGGWEATDDPTENGLSAAAFNRRWLAPLCADSAFGMGVVSAPLMMWETYQFHPAQLGLFFAVVTLISMASSAVAGSIKRSIPSGFLLTAIGLFGFLTALYLSRVTNSFNGLRAGRCLVWTSGVVAGIGYGLLRSALPKSVARSRLPDEFGTILIAISAMFASLIWAIHERVSLGLPVVLALAGLGVWLRGESTNRRAPAEAVDLAGQETAAMMAPG